MNKKIIVLILLFAITPLFSQNSENGRFVRTIGPYNSGLDVTVTHDSSIWIYSINEIVVLNSDGSTKNTIPSVKFQGIDYNFNGVLRGISTDCDGNVLCIVGNILYKIDYKTYECLGRIQPFSNTHGYCTNPVSDSHGNVLVGFFDMGGTFLQQVFKSFTSNFELISTIEGFSDYGTYIAITPDGVYLYLATLARLTESSPNSPFTTGGVVKYYSTNGVLGGYWTSKHIGANDKISKTVSIDSKGRLWVGYQGINRPSGFDCYGLYKDGLLHKEEIIGGLTSVEGATTSEQGAIKNPRGIAFSLDGKKAYICDSDLPYVQEWEIDLEWDASVTIDAEQPKVMPKSFVLSQNYPNPFNPTTNFSYSVPNKTDVRIAIYDLFGKEIKTLVNENKEAGTYIITWNGKDNNNRQVSTGVYFYKMQAGGFQKTMKMMLMK